ncbi:putative L-type lectin-like domain-containing protein [Glarea lozoyensis 74030]|uniref:Putative L-type lectin-like domain-containing protein n=1 Tax=Glarea lozoyensis (strain ATCC 74030 / MF5533) TaxID=1104152 RepID=H0EWY3_GLAL7|nr:putative L-type lectin-like domain-containing protein [Glarea lozoyensis 74030]
MGFLRGISAALGLAAAVFAGPHDQTTTNADGIRSIPLRTHTLDSTRYSQIHSTYLGSSITIRMDILKGAAYCYELGVEFKIHGSNNLHGDGFAMWLTKQRATQGDVFGSVDRFDGLGIFFDTYKNNRPGTVFPYVMAMVGDGNKPYDKANDGKDNELLGCSARGIRNANIPTKLRLTYFQDKSLKLMLSYKAEDQWELCWETLEPPTIPSVAYLGFSAETGELSDNHDIISVHTKNLYDTKSRESNTITTKEKGSKGSTKSDYKQKESTGGSWTWFFFKVIVFVINDVHMLDAEDSHF